MNEIVQRYVGKLCIIYTLSGESSQVQGTITETDGTWIVVKPENYEQTEIIKLEYVVRIKEYPMKNGKKAAFFS